MVVRVAVITDMANPTLLLRPVAGALELDRPSRRALPSL